MQQPDQRMTALLDALDTWLPFVRYRLRRLPDGRPCAALRVHGTTRMLVYAHGRQWICMTESTSGTPVRQTLGTVDEPPRAIVGRITIPRGKPAATGGRRVARMAGIALAAAAGASVLAAVVMAILVLGNGYGYGSAVVRWTIYILALVIGVSVGAWAARRYWIAGRTRDKDGW
ncbi:hypothetical protein ACIBEJ_14500 [Nonomuraea sp. NPDC050790]|uniref:hypothetical protein n=1 Tax=Nonomuraea sp. NPDC050790 TaxID=3364371 RepID=UPI0037B78FAE